MDVLFIVLKILFTESSTGDIKEIFCGILITLYKFRGKGRWALLADAEHGRTD